MRILVVEDEQDLNHIIAKKLIKDGYTVDSCYDGDEALHILSYTEYDGIILDVMMPKIDGFEVIKQLREKDNHTPILLLTAKDTVPDKVYGLDLGANDYLVKPFSFAELTARIRSMTRKVIGNTTNIYTLADLTLNSETRTVSRSGNAIILSAKELSLLEYMIRNKGIVLSREKIENNIWNFDYAGGTNAVDVYIRYLRKKIDEPYEPKLIHTVRGSGYVLREE